LPGITLADSRKIGNLSGERTGHMTSDQEIGTLDPSYDTDVDYRSYWTARSYEHRAEVMALSRLLRGRRFRHAVDVGGGYGRLSAVLSEHADRVTLTDPSYRQLEVAEGYLEGHR
jgi:SAM-dependent methyltransferase